VLPGQLAVAVPGFNVVGVRELHGEPPLACYAFARCPGQTRLSAHRRHRRRHRCTRPGGRRVTVTRRFHPCRAKSR
jgi:hypothetical protein